MNTKGTRALILIAGLLFAVLASSQEKKIKRSDLPPAVEKTVAAQSAGATVKGFSKETEKGQTYYEAEMLVNGHTKDILIDTNGAIVEVEEEVAMDALPAEVKAGLQARAGDGKLVKLLVRDPTKIAIVGANQQALGCGRQKPRKISVEYFPKTDPRLATSGDVATIEFPE